jgi:hypothetical protein
MTHVIVLALLLAGFACLSLSMTRHQTQWLAHALPPSQARLLRGLGFLLVAAGLPVAVATLSGSFGAVAWFGHMSLAAGAVFLGLLWRRRWMEKHSKNRG